MELGLNTCIRYITCILEKEHGQMGILPTCCHLVFLLGLHICCVYVCDNIKLAFDPKGDLADQTSRDKTARTWSVGG